MKLMITIQNLPDANVRMVEKIIAAVKRLWRIDFGRDEKDIEYLLEEDDD